jgi:DNA repair photolyase
VHRHADALARDLLSALEAPDALPYGYALLDWDVDHGISLVLRQGDRHLLLELSARDDSVDCLARTARFNLTARDPFAESRDLDPQRRGVIDAVVVQLLQSERRLPQVARQSAVGARTQVRSITVERALVREGRGQYYLNPYVGCTIGCSFCFVEQQADLARGLEGLPRLPWGRWVDVKSNLPEVLREEVQRLPPGIVRMSPIVTDPYQPLERRHRVTRSCLQVLLEHGFSVCVLTRAARIREDIELLARFEHAWVGVSIPTDDDRIRHAFEPGADAIETRLECLAECRAAGLKTFAVVQPTLPQDPERLVDLLAPVIDVVRIDRMHCIERVQHIYEATGTLEATGDAWFEGVQRRLSAGFARHGVKLHALDDLHDLYA